MDKYKSNERSLVLLKPDALERNLEWDILHILERKGAQNDFSINQM